MAFATADERDELVDLVAQAVIDRIEERDRINNLADMVVARVFALQREEDELKAKRSNALAQKAGVDSTSTPTLKAPTLDTQ